MEIHPRELAEKVQKVVSVCAAKIIGDVKNVAHLSNTSQLRDFAAYAANNGYTFELTVRTAATFSGPVEQAILGGSIVLRYLP